MKVLTLILFLTITEAAVLDLSHNYNESTQSWPNAKKFQLEKKEGFIGDKFWYASNQFCTAEHSGTHLDAPRHFNQNGWSVEQIPLESLFEIPAVVVDISQRISENIHPLDLVVEDLEEWEKKFGKIPDNSIVIMDSGWTKHWFDANLYFNTSDLNDMKSFNFPGIEPTAATWLVENRNIVAVGVDSASVDGKGEATSHQILTGKNKLILENLVQVDKLPAKGAFIYAFPMKIEGGSGAPCRVIAKF